MLRISAWKEATVTLYNWNGGVLFGMENRKIITPNGIIVLHWNNNTTGIWIYNVYYYVTLPSSSFVCLCTSQQPLEIYLWTCGQWTICALWIRLKDFNLRVVNAGRQSNLIRRIFLVSVVTPHWPTIIVHSREEPKTLCFNFLDFSNHKFPVASPPRASTPFPHSSIFIYFPIQLDSPVL